MLPTTEKKPALPLKPPCDMLCCETATVCCHMFMSGAPVTAIVVSISTTYPFKERGQVMSTNVSKILTLGVASLLVLLSLAACGGPSSVTADLTDTSIQVSSNTATAGSVTFHIKNTSAAEMHEFVIIQTDLRADQLPFGADGSVEEDKLSSPGEKGDIAAGQGADLTLTLPAGHYMFICNQPGHYQAGMHVAFTVTS